MKKTTNNFYLVMEFCNGGDLDAYVKKRKFLTEEEAIEIHQKENSEAIRDLIKKMNELD